jgi:hypothetical protein
VKKTPVEIRAKTPEGQVMKTPVEDRVKTPEGQMIKSPIKSRAKKVDLSSRQGRRSMTSTS